MMYSLFITSGCFPSSFGPILLVMIERLQWNN